MYTLLAGAYFRPPAKSIIANCPAGTELKLERDEFNPYDEMAIAVYIEGSVIPASRHETLESELEGIGFTLEEVVSQSHHVGFIAASGGKPLLKAQQSSDLPLIGNAEICEILSEIGHKGFLCFDSAGNVLVEIRKKD